MTIGIAADSPSTAFGYIHVGAGLEDGPGDVATTGGEPDGGTSAAPSGAAGTEPDGGTGAAPSGAARHVLGFTEKPDADTAAAYLRTGEYRWNAGMFVVRARVLLEHLRRLQPALADGLTAIAADWDTDRQEETTARIWPTLTRIAIDHAIAEPVAATGGVAVVPGDFTWDDVGD